jgi:hypothetical protein
MGVPVWLLDVDGVLNASRPAWSGPPRQATATAGGQSYRLRWAPALLERLRQLHLDGHVELRWATTWCPDAQQLERLWALPALVRALDEGDTISPGHTLHAKVSAALAVLEEERRPLVWADDDAIPSFGPERARLENGPAPALLLTPSPGRGLTREDLNRIQTFLDHLRT